MKNKRLPSWLYVLLATLFVLVRGFGDVLTALAEYSFIGVFGPLIGHVLPGLAPLGEAVGLAVFFAVTYDITPEVYPSEVDYLTERDGFRLLTALFSTWLAAMLKSQILMGKNLTIENYSSYLRWPLFLGLGLVVFWVSLVVYVEVVDRRTDGDLPDWATIANSMVPFGDFDAADIRNRGDRYAQDLLTLAWWSPMLLFSSSFVALSFLSPVGELGVVAGLLVGRTRLRYRVREWFGRDPETAFDFERLMSIGVRQGTHAKRLVTLLLVVEGVFLSADLFMQARGMEYSDPFVRYIEFEPTAKLLQVTLLLVSLYIFFHWMVELRRLPQFLSEWEKRSPPTSRRELVTLLLPIAINEDDTRNLPARPPWFTFPASILTFSVIEYVEIGFIPYGPWLPNTYLLYWAFGLVALLGAVLATWLAKPQPGLTEQYAIPLAAVTTNVTWTAAARRDPFLSGLLVVLLVSMFYFPEISAWYSHR